MGQSAVDSVEKTQNTFNKGFVGGKSDILNNVKTSKQGKWTE